MLYLPTAEEHADGGSTSCSSSPPMQLLSAVSSGAGTDPCIQCHQLIHDRYVLVLEGRPFHSHCLRCSFCYNELSTDMACHVKEGLLICRSCYPVKYRRACLKCGMMLMSEDLVMKARETVFHLNCFTCCICGTQLNSGETFAMNEQCDLFCQIHTQLNLAAPDSVSKQRSEDSEEHEDEHQPNNRSKRMRTSFKHHQLKAMKLYFTLNHNPDAKDLKQLAQKTGLTKRVLQVWFQNARAKYRRSMQGRDGHGIALTTTGNETPTHPVIPQRSGEFTPTSPKYEPESPNA